MARTAVAHFATRRQADAAYDELVNQGFDRDAISIIGQGREGGKGLRDDDTHDVKAGEGAAVGGVAGLLLGAAAMLIPGIGPIVAVGPLAAALAGAVTGGVTGAVVGGITAALVHTGVDEDTARYYDERLQQGGVVLTVQCADEQYDAANRVLSRHDGDLRAASVGSGAAPAGTASVRQVAAAADNWDSAMPDYRDRWQQQHGNSDRNWDQYAPTYRFGWEARREAPYRDRDFAAVESSLRGDWERRYPDKPWDQAVVIVREMWEEQAVRDDDRVRR